MGYVIRSVNFGYNDEWYTLYDKSLGAVVAQYDQPEAAQAALAQRVQAQLQDGELYQYAPFAEGVDDALAAALNDLCVQAVGRPLVDGHGSLDESVLQALSPEQALALAQTADIAGYELIEVAEQQAFYRLWLPQQQDWVRDAMHGNALTEPSVAALAAVLEDWQLEMLLDDVVLPQGSLAALSAQPELLASLLQTGPMAHDADTGTLSVTRTDDLPGLLAVNALLREPFLQLQTLTVEALLQAGS